MIRSAVLIEGFITKLKKLYAGGLELRIMSTNPDAASSDEVKSSSAERTFGSAVSKGRGDTTRRKLEQWIIRERMRNQSDWL
jgi:hypothetical protein